MSVKASVYLPWLLPLAPLLTGCEPAARPSPSSAATDAPGQGAAPHGHAREMAPGAPSDALRLIHELRLKRDYQSLAQFLPPERRDNGVQFLRAVDGVIDASRLIHAEAERKFHAPLPPYWHFDAIENNLGPFSRDVTVIKETPTGETATVTIRESDHLPLMHVPMALQNGRWTYELEPIAGATVTELDALAQMLREVAASIGRGAPYNSLEDAFRYRISPQIARTQSMALAAAPGDPP